MYKYKRHIAPNTWNIAEHTDHPPLNIPIPDSILPGSYTQVETI